MTDYRALPPTADLCGSRVAVDPKHIEWSKSSTAVFKKILYLFVIFSFACVAAGQFDFEAKPPNVISTYYFPSSFSKSRTQVK